jgi:glycine cleavage system H protein
MNIPAELKYTKWHQWLRQEADGTVTVGITEAGQELLGDVVFVESPQVGRKLSQGEQCGVVESVKSATDVPAPLSGEIVAVNGELADAPEKINQDAYGAWLFRMKPDGPAAAGALFDAAAYQEFAEG